MAVRLKRLSIHGFKTIRHLKDFELKPINALIGANGAGKSNFISFFRFMSWVIEGRMQEHIARVGGANAILHDGGEQTPQIEAELTLETDSGENDYYLRLFWAAGDTLIFAEECYRFSNRDLPGPAPWKPIIPAGHRESALVLRAEGGEDTTARVIRGLLQKCKVYQFHNTSETAKLRGKFSIEEGRWLREDGANLAPFLWRLRQYEEKYYNRIVETLRMILPFFHDFELEPEYSAMLLKWKERGSDVVFNASQASDGMLRTMALVALLGQPERDLPVVLFLDEPELGLHPYAVSAVMGLLRSAARHVQVVLATQSTALVDQFSLEEIVVTDRVGRESTFTRLEEEPLREWLEEYSLSELWEKNVLGGLPTR